MTSRFGAADHPGAAGEPGADRQVGVPGDQRRDQRQQRGQVGGQVDVHVGEHRRRPSASHAVAQRPAAALLGQHAATSTPGSSAATGAATARVRVGAGVVGDGDPERVGQLRGQVRVQPADARLEVGLLVVHRDDDVEHRRPRAGRLGAAGGREQAAWSHRRARSWAERPGAPGCQL